MSISKSRLVENFYQSKLRPLLFNWTVTQKMSAVEIQEKINEETTIRVTRQSVWQWLKKYGLERSHGEAMALRVRTGRMNYEHVKERDFISDYRERDRKRGYKWANCLTELMQKRNISSEDLANSLGCSVSNIISWCSLEQKVSEGYQEKIECILKSKDIFYEQKSLFREDIPLKKENFRNANLVKQALSKKGYAYAKNMKMIMRKKQVLVKDVVSYIRRSPATVSHWIHCKTMVSLGDQRKLAKLFDSSVEELFS